MLVIFNKFVFNYKVTFCYLLLWIYGLGYSLKNTNAPFLTDHPCDLISQGSSNNSRAVFRFSGSHCSIELIKLINSSLSPPSRFPSAASRLLDGKSGKRSGSFSSGSSHLPYSSNHSADLLPRFTSSSGGGPIIEISSVR